LNRNNSQSSNTERRDSGGRHTAVLVIAAAVAIALVAGFGWIQFRNRARGPIETVKVHAIPGTDVTIGEGIGDFIADRGIKVATDGFKPSWGAEQTSNDEWVVSYVFEVGRRARWISWKVNPESGEVVPRDDLAGELWKGQ